MIFHGREAVQVENDHLRVTVLKEGGHLAEVLHKAAGISPLWIPPWKSIEPSRYDPALHPEYGGSVEAKLLAGIMGHNLCLDLFGSPSPEEVASGYSPHGEASVAPYELTASAGEIRALAHFPLSALRFERRVRLIDRSPSLRVSETLENLLPFDRPIAWTQHVTLGPPFLENGITQFRHNGTRSQVFGPPPFGMNDLLPGAQFSWPHAPLRNGASVDLSTFSDAPKSGRFTTHLLDPASDQAFFVASNPKLRLSIGYRWQRSDFPWLGLWEENRSRSFEPWNSRTVACGLEFGVSPFPESRREMVERGLLFGAPTSRWLAARETVRVEYSIAAEFDG